MPVPLARTTVGGCLAAALAACAGSPMHVTPGATTQQPGSAPIAYAGVGALGAAPTGSWMAADAERRDLLYITTLDQPTVYVYSYPDGRFEGRLTGFNGTTDPCVDSTGDVFVPDNGRSEVVEYAHGQVIPIATLFDEKSSEPNDCAVDPTTGNLAVANYIGQSGGGDVVVYPKARPPYEEYSAFNIGLLGFCSYDGAGNLFVDDLPFHTPTTLAELPRGQHALMRISLPQGRQTSGALQWDGKYLTINGPSLVYRLQIDGQVAQIVGSTPLSGSSGVAGYSIPRLRGAHADLFYSKLVAPDYNGADVKIWKYPEGGNAIKTIRWFGDPYGAVVSPASR
jgi:hypothetical protein